MGQRIAGPIPALAVSLVCGAVSLFAAVPPAPGAGVGSTQYPAAPAPAPVSVPAIVFGFTPDARPLSYAEIIQGNKTGQVLGFCRLLYDHLVALGHQVEPRELPFDERFGWFGRALGGRPGLQCGPSSLTPGRLAELAAADDQAFRAEVTRPFLVTTSRLLIRRTQVPALDQSPEDLRIGVLKPRPGRQPVTSEVVQAVFPNAHFVGLSSRTEAVQRLTQAADAPGAIDAYASDDLMLRDMLAHAIPDALREDYALEPTLSGYSREEYVLVVYNAPELAAQVTQWLDSPGGKHAARALVPPTDPLLGTLTWLARSDHLSAARPALFAGLALSGSAFAWLIWLVWRRWRRRRDDQAWAANTAAAPLLINEGATPQPGNDADPARHPALPLLTPREQEVLALTVQGRTAKEAGRALDVSDRTIESHRRSISNKLGTKNTAELVAYALANPELLQPPPPDREARP